MWGPTETAELTATGLVPQDRFGGSVSISDWTALIGAAGDNGNTGAAFVFVRKTPGVWALTQSIKLTASDAAPVDHLGFSVSISSGVVIAGANLEDEGGMDGGAVYVFEPLTCRHWNPHEKSKFGPGVAMAGSGLGFSVSIDGATVLAGAPLDDEAAPGMNAGAAYVFTAGVGRAFCFGDGAVSACPCANGSDGGEGCANSSGDGAVLCASGTNGSCTDDLFLHGRGMLPNQPALLFAGEDTVNGGNGDPFGDGLRCAGGGVVRLGILVPDAAGSADWGPGLAATGGWSGGDVRRFQAWYRDPGGPCNSGFNLSNGVEVSFFP